MPLWLRTAGDMEGPGKTERRQHLSPRILSKTNKPSSHLRKYILGLQLVPKAGQAGTPSLGPQTQSCPRSRARRQCEPNRPGTRLEGGWRHAFTSHTHSWLLLRMGSQAVGQTVLYWQAQQSRVLSAVNHSA